MYNKNLSSRQFPESHRGVTSSAAGTTMTAQPPTSSNPHYGSTSSSNALTAFSPKREYYKHVKREAKLGKQVPGHEVEYQSNADLPAAPAWSLAGRNYPPDMKAVSPT